MESTIFIVDDDRDFLQIMEQRLRRLGFKDVFVEEDPLIAADWFQSGNAVDLALLDMTMPNMDGVKLLDIIKKYSHTTECIMITAVNEARAAVICLRKGAYDYLIKPVTEEDLALSIHRALEHKRLLDVLNIEKGTSVPQLKNREAFQAIQTASPRMHRVLKEAELHASSNVPILITGESGTGKELLAKAIHQASPRASFPFTAVNMASLNADLFDAEFFGHTKGAFTGAERNRIGYLEHTNKGSLFLDEIGLLPMEVQGKLLRFLQDGQYLKLGTSVDQFADVRFIAATNAELEDLMARNLFRKDLYYRIRGGWLHIPPLRHRKEDIPMLLNIFLKESIDTSPPPPITAKAMTYLMHYDYPGNIRELKSIIQAAANLAQDRPISEEVLPDAVRKAKIQIGLKASEEICQPETIAGVERKHILRVYQMMQQNKSKTARVLDIGLNTLRRKLASYDKK
jgi:DNA-binding NtrC family response regulator